MTVTTVWRVVLVRSPMPPHSIWRCSIGWSSESFGWYSSLERIEVQGWNGAECAARLTGVSQPTWQQCVVWRDPHDDEAMWRADETDLLPGPAIGTSVLATDPSLPDDWWQSFNASLDALASQHTTRTATPDTMTISQDLVTQTIQRSLPEATRTSTEQWQPAHADLNWANMTAPRFCLFDWEDWGMAPRGLDAASLWGNSLAVPELAAHVRHERHHDLDSRDGKVMMLFVCAKILAPDAHPEDPRLAPARDTATKIIAELEAS
ncbi:hypothetical protein ACFYW6_36555 [Streptomyces sp. NPDC002659]|uniref:hypothetical protein n=1 Tax=Streptomyces sp. NPDC002659 TaxID=3364656 RepID=UPI00368EC50F